MLERPNNQEPNFENLPPEITQRIFSYLTPEELASVAQVSHSSNNNVSNLLWKKKFANHFPAKFEQKTIKDTLNWKTEFPATYKQVYQDLPKNLKKLLSLVKENDIENLKKLKFGKDPFLGSFSLRTHNANILPFSYLQKAGFLENNESILLWANRTKQQDFLTNIYEQVTLVEKNNEQRFFWAVACNQPQAVNNLINSASPALTISEINLVFHKTIYLDNYEMTLFLLSKGARPHHFNYHALATAAKQGSLNLVKLLIEHGASIDQLCKGGKTSLLLAIEHKHIEVSEFLLSQDANIIMTDEQGNTPLHYAAAAGLTSVIEVLLARGYQINRWNDNQETPLHLAAKNNQFAAVNTLINMPEIDLHAVNKDGSNALHYAAHAGHLDMVKRLFEAGINIDETTHLGATALFFAAGAGHTEICEFLIAKGANPNSFCRSRRTPLHIAAHNGHLNTVNTLLANGANINAVVGWVKGILSFGLELTPLYVATYHGHTEIAKTLNRSRLENYINEKAKRDPNHHETSFKLFDKPITFGNSAEEKLAAAVALRAVANGANPAILKGHEKALLNGKLDSIRRGLGIHVDSYPLHKLKSLLI